MKNKYYPLSTFCLLFFCTTLYSQVEGFAYSTDKTPVYYKVFGKGYPLLIINGGPGMNSSGFEDLAIKLSASHKVILYDQRGTGRSVMKVIDSSTVSIKLMMDDIEALRKHLQIEKWILFGHSFGGMLASYYATVCPRYIEKIILSSSGGIDLGLLDYVAANINAKLTSQELQSVRYWNQKINEGDTSYHARLERGMNLAPAYVHDKKWVPLIAERLTHGNPKINQLVWDNLRRIGYNCRNGLKTFNQPVLIIQGKEDIVNRETAELSHKAFRNSRMVFIDHCVHYGWLDNESQYFKELYDFLRNKL